MTEKYKKYIESSNIYDYAFLPFDAVKDRLINCAAKQRIPEKAKTVMVFLFPYKVYDKKSQLLSRYAAVPDYHNVIKRKLQTVSAYFNLDYRENEFEPFVDNSPLPEVDTAAMAGLGIKGKNGLLITEKYGSYVFIGEIITDLDMGGTVHEIKYCRDCGKCYDACRVHLDKSKCLSKLSQTKGILTPEELSLLKEEQILWGCDRCAEVCPENKAAENTYVFEFYDGYRDAFSPDDDHRGRAYMWRGLDTIKRNYVNLQND